jgi:hypothetical protein
MLVDIMGVAGPLVALLAFCIGWHFTEGPKCALCKKRGTRKYESLRGYDKDPIKSVWHTQYHKSNVYKDMRVYTHFHPTCIKETLKEAPHGEKIELALTIIDRYKQNKQWEVEEQKRKEWAKNREFVEELRRRLKLKSTLKQVREDGLFLD